MHNLLVWSPALRARLELPKHRAGAKKRGWGIELRPGECKACNEETDLTYLDICPPCFKASANGPRVVNGALVLCHTCDTVYLPAPGQFLSDSLPCGHTDVSYMMPSAVFTSVRNSRFVDWANRRGLLAEAIEELQDAGGNFDPGVTGPARLTLPGGAS